LLHTTFGVATWLIIKPPMLGRTKVLGKAKRGEVRPTNVQLPSQPQAYPTPWR